MNATRAVWVSVVAANLLLYAGRGVLAAELVSPPKNAQAILRYQLEQKVKSKLASQVQDAKRDFDSTVNKLGKLCYDKFLTEGGAKDPAKKVQELVEQVIARHGKRSNPEFNYQEDLKAVIEAAADTFLPTEDLGALRDYVRKDMIEELLEAVGIAGMKDVTHLVNRKNVDGIFIQAREKAQRRLSEEIEKAKQRGEQLRNRNDRWKKILDEEFTAVATRWVLNRLEENWGVKLTLVAPDRLPAKRELEDSVKARTGEILEANSSLEAFIYAQVQDVFATAASSNLPDEQLKARLAELFETLRNTLGEPITEEKEKNLVKQAAGQHQRPSPYGPSTAESAGGSTTPQGQVAQGLADQGQPAAVEPGLAGNTNSPAAETPTSPAAGTSTSSGQTSPPHSPTSAMSSSAVGLVPIVGALFQEKPHEFWFLIELRMRNPESNDVVLTIHLLRQAMPSGRGDDIEKPNLMPTRSFVVGKFTKSEIEKAANAVQDILEGISSFNKCVDEAQERAGMGSDETPPVQLNLKLVMLDGVFGPVWENAVREGVTKTANNDWAGVTIRFCGLWEGGG